MTGTSGRDRIDGRGNADTLIGGNDNDSLYGGDGTDFSSATQATIRFTAGRAMISSSMPRGLQAGSISLTASPRPTDSGSPGCDVSANNGDVIAANPIEEIEICNGFTGQSKP